MGVRGSMLEGLSYFLCSTSLTVWIERKEKQNIRFYPRLVGLFSSAALR